MQPADGMRSQQATAAGGAVQCCALSHWHCRRGQLYCCLSPGTQGRDLALLRPPTLPACTHLPAGTTPAPGAQPAPLPGQHKQQPAAHAALATATCAEQQRTLGPRRSRPGRELLQYDSVQVIGRGLAPQFRPTPPLSGAGVVKGGRLGERGGDSRARQRSHSEDKAGPGRRR
jgi:hypothetical protein